MNPSTKLYRRRPETIEVWQGTDDQFDEAPGWAQSAIRLARFPAFHWIVIRNTPDGEPLIIGASELMEKYEEIEPLDQWPNGPMRPE